MNFNLFNEIITEIYNKCFPVKTKYVTTKRLQNAWLTRGILNSIKHKSNLFKIYKLGTIPHHVFKHYRNNLTQVIRSAKWSYYRQIFSNFRTNTKKIWQIINEIKGNSCNKNNPKTLHYDNTEFSNPRDISEAFSKYFSNIAPHLDNKLPRSNRNFKDYLTGDFPNSMQFPILTPYDVQKVIQKLKNKNLGVTDIAVPVIKRNCILLSHPLPILFNQSVSTGTFPSALKFAKVTPIYKSGPNNDPKNYRPISQLR